MEEDTQHNSLCYVTGLGFRHLELLLELPPLIRHRNDLFELACAAAIDEIDGIMSGVSDLVSSSGQLSDESA